MFHHLFVHVGPVASMALLLGLLAFPLVMGLAWTISLAPRHARAASPLAGSVAVARRISAWLEAAWARLFAVRNCVLRRI